MNVIAIVPARSGSKGFPHKNMARINGKTLIELAVKVGLDCKDIKKVYISTDSYEYEKTALEEGAESLGLRPEKFATDTAKSSDAVIDLITRLREPVDYVVLLQPTSPIRSPRDISKMLNLLTQTKADAIVSVEKLEEPHPNKLKQITAKGFLAPFIKSTSSEVPRQLLPAVYKLNGAIYIVRTSTLMAEGTFLPPAPFHTS